MLPLISPRLEPICSLGSARKFRQPRWPSELLAEAKPKVKVKVGSRGEASTSARFVRCGASCLAGLEHQLCCGPVGLATGCSLADIDRMSRLERDRYRPALGRLPNPSLITRSRRRRRFVLIATWRPIKYGSECSDGSKSVSVFYVGLCNNLSIIINLCAPASISN